MQYVTVVVHGSAVPVMVWEPGLGQFEAKTWLHASQCRGPHGGCTVGGPVTQAHMGRHFVVQSASADEALRMIENELSESVIPA